MWFKHNEKESVAMETNVIFKARINLIFISEFYKKRLDYPGDGIMLLGILSIIYTFKKAYFFAHVLAHNP